MRLAHSLVEKLTAVDTATICNALEIANSSKRTNTGFTVCVFQSAYPEMKPILGFAGPATLRTDHPHTDKPDDLIHAHRHGAAVIPLDLLDKLPAAIDLVFAKETPIIEAAQRPGFSVEHLKIALRESEDIH